jgi:LacI family transcriptional regulator
LAGPRPITGSAIPSVVTDNFAGAQLATRHLIEHGYKRIACLTGEINLYTIHERIRGYRKAIESAGLECILNTSIQDYKSVEHAVENMLAAADPPDAIFTLKNSVTIHTFEVLQKLNVSVPGSIALLGYDDFELAATLRPSISVVRQPIDEIGHIAAQLLFERLLGPDKSRSSAGSSRPQQVQLKTHLIRRSSCGCSLATS